MAMEEHHVVDRNWKSLGFLRVRVENRTGTLSWALPPNLSRADARFPGNDTEETIRMDYVVLHWTTISTRRPNSNIVWEMPVLQTATDTDAEQIFRCRPSDFQTMPERFGSPREIKPSPATLAER